MGANSIDISQYRSRIGTFVGKKMAGGSSKASIGSRLKLNNIMNSFLMLSYLLVLSNVTQILLIISGVELNPGPGPEAGKNTLFVYLSERITPFFPTFYTRISTHIFIAKTTALVIRAANQQVFAATQVQQVESKQHISFAPRPVMTYAQKIGSQNPMVPRPQIDATDRRQIEAVNEDKAHTTKETFDDIKRIHDKEKKKKEQNNAVLNQTGMNGEALVRKLLI